MNLPTNVHNEEDSVSNDSKITRQSIADLGLGRTLNTILLIVLPVLESDSDEDRGKL